MWTLRHRIELGNKEFHDSKEETRDNEGKARFGGEKCVSDEEDKSHLEQEGDRKDRDKTKSRKEDVDEKKYRQTNTAAFHRKEDCPEEIHSAEKESIGLRERE